MPGIAPTRDAIETSIRRFVATASGLPITHVIPGNDGGSAPDGTYATVLLVTATSPGDAWADETAERGAIRSRTYLTIEAIYSIQFFRDGAQDHAQRLRLFSYSSAGILDAERRRFSIIRAEDVRQLDSVVSEEWEERAVLDLVIGYVLREADAKREEGIIIEADVKVNERPTITIREDL